MIIIDKILDVEKYIQDVNVVIFDLDDTLYSEKEYVKSGFHKIAEFFNNESMEKELWQFFEKKGKPIDEIISKYNLQDKKDEAVSVYRNQIPAIHLYAGVKEMLHRIMENKKVGIITDGRPEGQKAKISSLGLFVDKIIITDELGGINYRKPNITAFVMMKEYFQTSYDHMVYIGDNLAKDFIAPEKLGMKRIWFRNKDGLYLEQ